MKVPKGKRVLIGNKEYKAGVEIPDASAELAGLKETEETEDSETKPLYEYPGSGRG